MSKQSFRHLESYKVIIKLKQDEERDRREIIELNNLSKSLKCKLASLTDDLQMRVRSEKYSMAEVKQVQKEIEATQVEMESILPQLEEAVQRLEARKPAFPEANRKFIKDAIPIVDQVLHNLLTHTVALGEANNLLLELRKEEDALQRQDSEHYSSFSFKSPVLRNQPGITSHHFKRGEEIANYQKEQWESFKKSVK